jgi:hypothetical protein
LRGALAIYLCAATWIASLALAMTAEAFAPPMKAFA